LSLGAIIRTSFRDDGLGLFSNGTFLSNVLTEEIAGAEKVDIVFLHKPPGKSSFASALQRIQNQPRSHMNEISERLTGFPNINIRRTPSLPEVLAPNASRKTGTALPAADDELTNRTEESVPAILSWERAVDRTRTDAKAMTRGV
jgi:hypothetical protein